MADTYLLIASSFLGATRNDIFVPLPGTDNDYQCAQKTDVVVDKTTLEAYPETFELIETLTESQKLAAWSRKYDDGIDWTPEVGDYFTDESTSLILYKIVDEDTEGEGDPQWGYIVLSGGSLFASTQYEAKSNFSQGRLHVTAFDIDESSSASGSGSGSGS